MKLIAAALLSLGLAAGAALAQSEPQAGPTAHQLYDDYLQAVAERDDARAEQSIEAAWIAAQQTWEAHPDTALFAFLLAQARIIDGDLEGAQAPAAFALEATSFAQHYEEYEARILYGASLTNTDPVQARAELEAGFAPYDREVERILGGKPSMATIDRLYLADSLDSIFAWYMSLPDEIDRRNTAGVGPRDDVIAARLYLASLQVAAGDSEAAGRNASLAHFDLTMPPAVMFTPSSGRQAQYLLKAGQIEYLAGLYERAASAFYMSAIRWTSDPERAARYNLSLAYLPSGEMAPGLGAVFAWLTLAVETLDTMSGVASRARHLGTATAGSADVHPGDDAFVWPVNYGRDCRYRWREREPLALASGETAQMGAVTIQFDFNGEGEVDNARIVGSAPVSSPEHEAAILAAAETWRANFSTPFSVPRGCRTNQMAMVTYYY